VDGVDSEDRGSNLTLPFSRHDCRVQDTARGVFRSAAILLLSMEPFASALVKLLHPNQSSYDGVEVGWVDVADGDDAQVVRRGRVNGEA
jgi:hypothetical protein